MKSLLDEYRMPCGTVRIEDGDKQMLFADYANLPPVLKRMDYYARFLHIEAWTLPCWIVVDIADGPEQSSSLAKFNVVSPSDEGDVIVARLHPSRKITAQDCKGLSEQP